MSYAASLYLVLACAAKMALVFAPGLVAFAAIAYLVNKSKSPACQPGSQEKGMNR